MYYDGRKIITGRPYETVYYPEHHLAQNDGTVGVHIIVAEKMLGRELTEFEVVHHIDFDKKNNNKSNLMIFDNIKSHSIFHICLKYNYDFCLKRINGVYSCERTTKTKRELHKTSRKRGVHKNYYCPICGKIKATTAHSDKICVNCYKIQRHNKSKCPEQNELEMNLKKYGNFKQVGEIYNVSDNAVRKWCRYYGLSDRSMFWRNQK